MLYYVMSYGRERVIVSEYVSERLGVRVCAFGKTGGRKVGRKEEGRKEGREEGRGKEGR
jgi:hypothetical protein